MTMTIDDVKLSEVFNETLEINRLKLKFDSQMVALMNKRKAYMQSTKRQRAFVEYLRKDIIKKTTTREAKMMTLAEK